MENSSLSSAPDLSDENLSYCLYYIDGNEIKFVSNFTSGKDILELLNVIKNTDIALETVCDFLEPQEAEQIVNKLNDIKQLTKERPVITPLAISRRNDMRI